MLIGLILNQLSYFHVDWINPQSTLILIVYWIQSSINSHLNTLILPYSHVYWITVDFLNFIVFFGPRPWHIEIRHRLKKSSTTNLFGFETPRLKIRRLKLWRSTVILNQLAWALTGVWSVFIISNRKISN